MTAAVPAKIEAEFRLIDVASFAALRKLLSKDRSLGRPPKLEWIKISDLVVDPRYQRDIQGAGRKNITRIAKEFDWSKFAPVIVAPVGGSRYAIVDGQHRVTAAGLCGLELVPCQVIDADRACQAAAYAAINANITQMSPMQVHKAKTAAGDEHAQRLNALCAEAGVKILPYPVQSKDQKAGDIMAVGMLYRMLGKFGPDVLTTALSCITRTRDGNPGWLRSQIVEALCVVLEAEPPWLESRKLLKAAGKIDIAAEFKKAVATATPGSSCGIVGALVEAFGEHLEKELA